MDKAVQPRAELLRVLGPLTAVALVVGSVIGSGIFKKPQAVAQNVQHFDLALAAWVLGGVLALLGALALAELGAMLPRAGGNYVYLKEAYGPLWGFLWGWVEFWILRTGSIAALATIFSESLGEILRARYALGATDAPAPEVVVFLVSDWGQRTLTVGVIAFLAVVNALGVRWGGLVQNLTTWVKVGSLVAIGVLPFALGQANPEYLSQPGPAPKAGTLVGFGAAVLGVLWAYHGWMNLSPLGEELRDPQRNVPRALMLGVGIIILVYVGANVAYAVVLPQATMADTTQVKVVAVSFAQRVFGPWGPEAQALAGNAISAAIMVSVFGALNANILIGPRTYFALGRDGLFPRVLGAVHATFRTPVLAILLQAGWAVALVLGSDLIRESASESPFDTLTNYVMFGAIIFETMVIAAIFIFRRTRPELPRPYRCWGYPVVPIVYVLVMAAVLANTVYDQPRKSAWGLVFILAGAGVYFATVWRRFRNGQA
jgi:amino acid transporter